MRAGGWHQQHSGLPFVSLSLCVLVVVCAPQVAYTFTISPTVFALNVARATAWRQWTAVLVVQPLLLALHEVAKARDRRVFEYEMLALRLAFDTRLGMHSPQ